MSSINPISNQDLQLDDIPNPDGDWYAWGRFAHTMNGYEVQGGFKPCADLVNGGEAKTTTELRCALFFEARRIATALVSPPMMKPSSNCYGRFGRRWKAGNWIELCLRTPCLCAALSRFTNHDGSALLFGWNLLQRCR
ncbi:hypothetical protein [Synechococcus sp. WH 8016]|uniref:hypothetical protein n=1 Tax=Synechococcus sp. WH 8016 TaxID=166318 RepID=UPI00022D8DC7|nr:hypothetical protein [Synechococcus sp. WH 8016]EHA63537.1 hypothetical protein Syn8016DRAFT_0578 [Synechococcus sp. WH 8016]